VDTASIGPVITGSSSSKDKGESMRVVDENGWTVYNGLLDGTGPILRFAEGGGFIDVSQLKPDQRLVPGSLTAEEMVEERWKRWPRQMTMSATPLELRKRGLWYPGHTEPNA